MAMHYEYYYYYYDDNEEVLPSLANCGSSIFAFDTPTSEMVAMRSLRKHGIFDEQTVRCQRVNSWREENGTCRYQ